MRLALAQANPTVGAIDANADAIIDAIGQARRAGAQILITGELAVCGYPPEDLLLRDDFLDDCRAAVDRIAEQAFDLVVCVGFPHVDEHGTYNALAVCCDGQVWAVYRKMHLPNYGVFDERRYFAAGAQPAVIRVDGHLVGLTVCEDIWLADGPQVAEARAGAQLIVNLSASPYHRGKAAAREAMIAQRARDTQTAYAYVNQVGGQDELVFDGGSMVIDHAGRTVARAGQFAEQLLICDVELGRVAAARRRDNRLADGVIDLPVLCDLTTDPIDAPAPAPQLAAALDSREEVYRALVLATRDYLHKIGVARAVLGMSGGIDSALVALIAADALGPENVTCVVMPSRYSSAETQRDARQMTRNLGCDLRELPIDDIVQSYRAALADEFEGLGEDATEENLQARARGNLLMALSNKHGSLLLSTGNKSEMSVGYCTLYGDMAGGFAVIKDVPKLLVFELTRWRNEQDARRLVPAGIIERPPSAELKPDQVDSDSLPPYEILDAILAAYIEDDLDPRAIVAMGYDPGAVDRVVSLLSAAEFKRRQAPPGPRVTARNLARDRRMPIVNRYRRSIEQSAAAVSADRTETPAPMSDAD